MNVPAVMGPGWSGTFIKFKWDFGTKSSLIMIAMACLEDLEDLEEDLEDDVP